MKFTNTVSVPGILIQSITQKKEYDTDENDAIEVEYLFLNPTKKHLRNVKPDHDEEEVGKQNCCPITTPSSD